MLKVGIIGCGLIGHKRADSLSQAELYGCADQDINKAEQFAKKYNIRNYSDWQSLLEDASIGIVIIATPHNVLADITSAAIQAKKHVLVEKPAARNMQELEPLVLLAKRATVCVRVGFNHRYHRAFQAARQLVDDGAIGELMYIRGRYGHGGRIGYEKEWRANPAISGGGELIDQGVHLIDLARWFLGDFVSTSGFSHTYYWDMPVEDNGFMLLKTATQKAAFLHASCTEWKNLFCMEIYGRLGKLVVEGLGGSYGIEKLTYYKMLPEMGPPETVAWEYPMADNSWAMEFKAFVQDIEMGRACVPGIYDAYEALRVVQEIYTLSGLSLRAAGESIQRPLNGIA